MSGLFDDAPDVTITVPGPPKPLQRARHRVIRTKTGRQFVSTYTPEESRSEQGAIRMFASVAMAGRPPFEGAIDFRLTAFLPVPNSWPQKKRERALAGIVRPTGKPDGDNLLKQSSDGLREICFRDDAQITDAMVLKRYSDRPRIVIEIRCIQLEIAA